MARKKVKWIVSWWDNDKDCEVHNVFETYESAMIKKFKLEKRGISSIVELK